MSQPDIQKMRPSCVQTDKYTLLHEFMHGRQGRLLDLGARNRILLEYLDTTQVDYISHDIIPSHDYSFDLEQPIPLPDRSFDFVVALDVLEHLENIHSAFAEMMRIASQYLIVTLPCMSNLDLRLKFLATGFIADKYRLYPEHQGDRHRWLTVYPEIYRFVGVNAAQHGFGIERAYNHMDHFNSLRIARPLYYLSRLAVMFNREANGLFTNVVTFIMKRQP